MKHTHWLPPCLAAIFTSMLRSMRCVALPCFRYVTSYSVESLKSFLTCCEWSHDNIAHILYSYTGYYAFISTMEYLVVRLVTDRLTDVHRVIEHNEHVSCRAVKKNQRHCKFLPPHRSWQFLAVALCSFQPYDKAVNVRRSSSTTD